ncbi:MAG TPA: hypothetical protein VGQ34_07380, partial [Sphingomicrobium sp.]|nr:hypothetical protein [Sphingomicrobium sp.]
MQHVPVSARILPDTANVYRSEGAVNIAKDAHVRNVVRITGDAAGPRVVMFSGTHGDEVSGIHALEKLFFDLYAGTRALQCGSLVLV